MSSIISILALLLGLVSIFCWIKVLIVIFKTQGAGLGILGILCPLFTFIWGWMKAKEHGLQQIMMIWTGVFIGSIILNMLGAAAMFSQLQSSGALTK
jgi:hypothetical protein